MRGGSLAILLNCSSDTLYRALVLVRLSLSLSQLTFLILGVWLEFLATFMTPSVRIVKSSLWLEDFSLVSVNRTELFTSPGDGFAQGVLEDIVGAGPVPQFEDSLRMVAAQTIEEDAKRSVTGLTDDYPEEVFVKVVWVLVNEGLWIIYGGFEEDVEISLALPWFTLDVPNGAGKFAISAVRALLCLLGCCRLGYGSRLTSRFHAIRIALMFCVVCGW